MIRGAVLAGFLLLTGQYVPSAHFPTAAACPVLAAWKMDEGSGTVFNDTSGNANTANIAVPATVTWTANAIKSGVTSPFFNGGVTGLTQDTLGSNINFNSNQPFTIAMWVNRGTSTTDDSYLGDLNTPTTFNGWEVGKAATGNRAIFFLVGTVGSDSLIVSGTNAVPASAITYLVFTYDATLVTSAVKIYMNATLETNISIQNTLHAGSGPSPNQRNFGRRTNQSQPFTGPMGYVEISGCVWDQAKISANFAGGPAIN